MKLKHYFTRFLNSIPKETHNDLQELICKSIVSKISSALGEEFRGSYLPAYNYSYDDIINGCQSGETRKVPYIMQNLKLNPHDYLKYYMLDSFTNGLYTDLLISSVTTFYNKGVQFIFDFEQAHFTTPTANPTLYVEFTNRGNAYYITTIIYQNPFNGDMEMEDFNSILTDSFYILNPTRCLPYLMEKILNGVSIIPYSKGKEINIVPIFSGYENTVEKHLYASYRHNQIEEGIVPVTQPILTTETLSTGKLHGYKYDITVNIGTFNQIINNNQ